MGIRFKYDVGAGMTGAYFAGKANAQQREQKYAQELALQQQRYGMQANARRNELGMRAALGGVAGVGRLGGGRAAAPAPAGRWLDPTEEAPGDDFATLREKRRRRYERDKAGRAGEEYDAEWMPKWEDAPDPEFEDWKRKQEYEQGITATKEGRASIRSQLPDIPANAKPADRDKLSEIMRGIDDILYSDRFNLDDAATRDKLRDAIGEYNELVGTISQPNPNEGALVQRPDGGFDQWEPGMGKPTHWSQGAGKEPAPIQDPAQEAAQQAAAEQQAQLEEQKKQQEEAAQQEITDTWAIAKEIQGQEGNIDDDGNLKPLSGFWQDATEEYERRKTAETPRPEGVPQQQARPVQGPRHAANLVVNGQLEAGSPVQYPDGSIGVAPGPTRSGGQPQQGQPSGMSEAEQMAAEMLYGDGGLASQQPAAALGQVTGTEEADALAVPEGAAGVAYRDDKGVMRWKPGAPTKQEPEQPDPNSVTDLLKEAGIDHVSSKDKWLVDALGYLPLKAAKAVVGAAKRGYGTETPTGGSPAPSMQNADPGIAKLKEGVKAVRDYPYQSSDPKLRGGSPSPSMQSPKKVQQQVKGIVDRIAKAAVGTDEQGNLKWPSAPKGTPDKPLDASIPENKESVRRMIKASLPTEVADAVLKDIAGLPADAWAALIRELSRLESGTPTSNTDLTALKPRSVR